MSTYNPDSGLYSFWANSADTRFKRVYQGVVYVLKGACEEYYGYFDMPRRVSLNHRGITGLWILMKKGHMVLSPIMETSLKGIQKDM